MSAVSFGKYVEANDSLCTGHSSCLAGNNSTSPHNSMASDLLVRMVYGGTNR